MRVYFWIFSFRVLPLRECRTLPQQGKEPLGFAYGGRIPYGQNTRPRHKQQHRLSLHAIAAASVSSSFLTRTRVGKTAKGCALNCGRDNPSVTNCNQLSPTSEPRVTLFLFYYQWLIKPIWGLKIPRYLVPWGFAPPFGTIRINDLARPIPAVKSGKTFHCT